MFKSILTRLFKSVKGSKSQDYYYFEGLRQKLKEADTSSVANNVQPKAVMAEVNTFTSQEEQYQYAFYDFLFGENTPKAANDELSQYIANKIKQLLINPNEILKSLPVLPTSLAKIIENIGNRNFDTDTVVDLLKQEPVITAKVVALANSPFYNRSGKEITEIKQAFMLLGVSGLSEGVINGFVSTLIPQSNLYFRHYGQKIWQHSLSTSVIAKQLISQSKHKQNATQGYLIGLICHLGEIIIYQLMLEAFTIVHPDHQPNSQLFKNLMSENANRLTYFMAKYWQFPPLILETLALQTKIDRASQLPGLFERQPISCYIYEAKIISQLELRIQVNDISQSEIEKVSARLIYSKEARQYLDKLMIERTTSVDEKCNLSA